MCVRLWEIAMEGERKRKRKRGEESEERDGATENRTHTRALAYWFL